MCEEGERRGGGRGEGEDAWAGLVEIGGLEVGFWGGLEARKEKGAGGGMVLGRRGLNWGLGI